MRFMALVIGIGDSSSFELVQGEPSFVTEDEDDASVTFLYPLFEKLAEETGQMIGPYDHASFAGERLAALKRMLTEAQPEHWQVFIGITYSRLQQPKELWKPLDRETLLNLIAAWERVAARAEELGGPVVCCGD
jgi:hypothetical protein